MNALADMIDEELARRARAGSSSCFEELARRFQAPLLSFLLRRGFQRADAEDILQDALVRAFESLHRYSDAFPFRAWMFTLTHRAAVSHVRKRRPAADLPEEALGRAAPVEEGLARREEAAGLWKAAREELSDDQFSAMWLYYAEEMPARQIGSVLGRTTVTVKVMLHRARRRLLARLRGSEREDGQAGESEVACERT